MGLVRRLATFRLGLAVALLMLAGGIFVGDFEHVDGLHPQRFGPEREVSSGCSAQHPPSFEPLRGSRNVDCPACLLKLQQHAAAPALVPFVAPQRVGDVGQRPASPAPPRSPCRLAPSRGPPVAA